MYYFIKKTIYINVFLYSIYFYYKTLLIVIINVPIVNISCSDDTGITRDSCVRTRRDQRTVAVGRALLLARALLDRSVVYRRFLSIIRIILNLIVNIPDFSHSLSH